VGTWSRYRDAPPTGESIQCTQNITFKNDGIHKKVQWRARDLAGNELTDLNYYTLKIDSTPVIFEQFSIDFNSWHRTLTPEISFTVREFIPINDESSGVDTNSIMYQISTTGLGNYGPWRFIDAEGTGESVQCTVKPTFIEGTQNYIRFKSKDIAGNEIISDDFQVKIDTIVPEFMNPVPDLSIWSNSTTIQCNITISDEHSKVAVESVRYAISTNGTDHYSNWRMIGIKHLNDKAYYTVTLTINDTFAESDNNYIRWLAYDIAGNNITSDDYQVKIDVTGCTFHDPTPAEATWINSYTIISSIIINDTYGSGIDISTIEYMTSNKGSVFSGTWKTKSMELVELVTSDDATSGAGDPPAVYSVKASVPVYIFNEGVDNYIKWRAKDMASNEYQVGGPYNIKIDLTPLDFYNPKPVPSSIQFELELTCRITIKDDENGSGVDPNSVEYRYSTDGENGYSDWSAQALSQIKLTDGYSFIVYITFLPGSDNYLQWRGADLAGNGPFESEDYNIVINSPPNPKITSPVHNDNNKYDYTTEDEIAFNGRKTTDPDGVDELTFYWESNKTGSLGYEEYFTRSLPSGKHKITLYVSDGHNHNASTHVNITVVKYREVKDTDGDGIVDYLDPDIDDDGVINAKDAFPEDKREWLDTDFDGFGNNVDLDDDGDEYPDDEDAYPLDSERWEAEPEDQSWIYLALISIIIIVLLLVVGLIVLRSKKKKEVGESTGADVQVTTPAPGLPGTAPMPFGTPTAPGPSPASMPMPYQQTMPIQTMHPYQLPQVGMGMGMSGPQSPMMSPQTLYMPAPPFPSLPPATGTVMPPTAPIQQQPVQYQQPMQSQQPIQPQQPVQPQQPIQPQQPVQPQQPIQPQQPVQPQQPIQPQQPVQLQQPVQQPGTQPQNKKYIEQQQY
jgi:hypothetical protein